LSATAPGEFRVTFSNPSNLNLSVTMTGICSFSTSDKYMLSIGCTWEAMVPGTYGVNVTMAFNPSPGDPRSESKDYTVVFS
jgi:hypothetical protein